jgi:hypothetical protein
MPLSTYSRYPEGKGKLETNNDPTVKCQDVQGAFMEDIEQTG